MRVCKYFLERCRNYLQLLNNVFYLNLYRFLSTSRFALTARSEQILSKIAK
jgi:hypothetical protein